MALRFANVIFESQWNNNAIDHVQITVAETVGVGSAPAIMIKAVPCAICGAKPPFAAGMSGGDGAAFAF